MTAVWTEEALAKRGLRIREQYVRVALPVAVPVEAVTLELPTPPSVNSCWANVAGVGRVRSQSYRRWHKLAFDELTLQRPDRVRGRFCAVITVGRKRGDLDNFCKPLLDLLSNTVTDDDANCERLAMSWSDDLPKDRIRITVRRAAA